MATTASYIPVAPASDTSIRSWFPVVQNRAPVKLPGHLAADQGPGIAEKDLHRSLPNNWVPLAGDANDSGHPEAIKDHYGRVRFAPIDGDMDLRVDMTGAGFPLASFRDLAACNNCLISCRRKEFLDTESIFYSMRRLIARMQTQDGAFLGPFAAGKWWIAPAAYVLRLGQQGDDPNTTATHHMGDPRLSGAEALLGARNSDRASFQAAEVTIHLCQSGAGNLSHFSLLVHHVPSGDTWHMDSSGILKDRKPRSDLANTEFQLWLENSGFRTGSQQALPVKHQRRAASAQDDSWTCGLHCMLNALVFVRYGVFGWKNVEVWNQDNGGDRLAMRALFKSLHHTLGIKYPPDGPRKAVTKNRKGSKPAKKKAKTAPADEPAPPRKRAAAKPAPAAKSAAVTKPAPAKRTQPPEPPATGAKTSSRFRDPVDPSARARARSPTPEWPPARAPAYTTPYVPPPAITPFPPPPPPSPPRADDPVPASSPAKRPRTEASDPVTPPEKRQRTKSPVTPTPGANHPRTPTRPSGSSGVTTESTLTTPTSSARQRARESAARQARTRRKTEFAAVVAREELVEAARRECFEERGYERWRAAVGRDAVQMEGGGVEGFMRWKESIGEGNEYGERERRWRRLRRSGGI